MLVLISPIFHTFSVNSQNIFLLAAFVCDKMFGFDVIELFLSQNNLFGIKIRNYFNISHNFSVRLKICALFFGLGKIDHVSHFCPMNTKIKKCIHIFYCR